MLKQMNINGSPCVGVFCKISEKIGIVPPNFSKKDIYGIRETFEVEIVKTGICNSSLIGPLTALNSKGMLVTDFVNENEVKKLEEKINVNIVSEKFNAFGNNILLNDKAALVHPQLSKKTMQIIEDTFDVDVIKGTIAGLKTVGSVAVATNRGILCHPKAADKEIKEMEELFGIPVSIGTVNYGMPYIGTGLIANTTGAITGANTTGIELGRIEEALFL